MKKINLVWLLFPFVLLFTRCAGSQEVSSLPVDKQIVIDGDQSDWAQLTSISKENIAFGFRNDSKNLYLCMITNDRSKIMKIMRGGLDVWLEPENSDNKIGIRYPEKPDPTEMMNQPRQGNQQRPEIQDQDGQRPPQMDEENNFNPRLMNELSKQTDLYILNSDEKIVEIYPINGETFKAKLNINNGVLCYELKIPIGESLSALSGLKTKTNAIVNVEFLSGDLSSDMERMQRPDMSNDGSRSSGPPSGGGDFPRGGGQGGPGGPPSGSGQNRQDTTPIDYSFNVTLYK